jgi:hypothetical protein
MQPTNYVLVTTYLSHSLGNDRAFAENRSAMKPRRRINRGSQCAIQLSNSVEPFRRSDTSLALPCAARCSSKRSHSYLSVMSSAANSLRGSAVHPNKLHQIDDRSLQSIFGVLAGPFITAAISTIGGAGGALGAGAVAATAAGRSCYSWLCRGALAQRAPGGSGGRGKVHD